MNGNDRSRMGCNAASIIKQSVTARQAAEELGIHVRSDGRCQCPIHNGKDYNMKLFPGSGGYYCFVCHASGDVIGLVRAVTQCTFMEAIDWLNSTFGLGLDTHTKPDSKAIKAAETASMLETMRTKNQLALSVLEVDVKILTLQAIWSLEADLEQNRPIRPYREWPKRYELAAKMLPVMQEMLEVMEDERIENRVRPDKPAYKLKKKGRSHEQYRKNCNSQ